MSKGTNQKLKLSYLTQIMLDKTDDEHALTMPQIMTELEKYDVTAERKSIYADFADMTDKLGIEIVKEQIGRETYYHVGSRDFELAEIKLLIEAIQASKFITEKKSNDLINKLKKLVSECQATQLSRQVFVQGRVKTMNESVYYNIDNIHKAIGAGKKISFKYYRWNTDKKLVPRNNDRPFVVSPWALTWTDERYFLVAYDDYEKIIKHYRVDKMKHIEVLADNRDGMDELKSFDMVEYCKMNLGMYVGPRERVKFEFENHMVGLLIDQFGTDISVFPIDEHHSYAYVDVAVSPRFYGWVLTQGDLIKIAGPTSVIDEMKSFVQEMIMERY